MSKIIRKTGHLFLVLTLTILLIFTGILPVHGIEKVDFSSTALSYGDYEYSYSGNEDTISILQYNGSDKSVEIPSIINGAPVISISDFAFMNNEEIEQVTIPDSVKKIGLGAFYGCSQLSTIIVGNQLNEVYFNSFTDTKWYNTQYSNSQFIKLNNVLLGIGSLAGETIIIPNEISIIAIAACTNNTNIKELYIPDSVSIISKNAFTRCENLTFVSFPKSLDIIGLGAFADCINLNKVVITGTTLHALSFSKCESIEKISFSNNVKNITIGCFAGCDHLTNIVLPSTINSIGDKAFGYYYENGVTNKKIPGVTIYGYPDSEAERYATNNSIPFVDISQDLITDDEKFRYHINDDSTVTIARYLGEEKTVSVPDTINGFDVTNIGKRAFSNNNYIENVYLPDNLQSISAFAFMECANLTAIDIPNSVERIEENVFCKCTNLTEVNLPNRLTKINTGVFSQCENLKEIIIPQGVTCIEDYAFSGCTELEKIELPQSLEIIGTDAFEDTAWYNNQPAGAIYIDHILYHYKGQVPHSLTIEEGTTYISPYVFDDGQDLEEIEFPDSLKQIGYGALSNTAWLNKQPYGEVVYAGKIAYKYKLSEDDYNTGNFPEEITIKDDTISICDFAFDGTKVQNVILPDSLEIIGNGAFWDCNISDITIPKNVQQIGENAFAVKYGTCLQTIRGYKGTAAERYAKENEITFITLEELVNSILGDADGDGEVGISDTTIIQRRLTNTSVPVPEDTLMNADVDGDGELTILDATFIQRHIAKISVPYPIGEPKA